MPLTLEMLEEKYQLADCTHACSDGSAEDAVRNGDSGVFVRTATGQTASYPNAAAESVHISKQKPQHPIKL